MFVDQGRIFLSRMTHWWDSVQQELFYLKPWTLLTGFLDCGGFRPQFWDAPTFSYVGHLISWEVPFSRLSWTEDFPSGPGCLSSEGPWALHGDKEEMKWKSVCDVHTTTWMSSMFLRSMRIPVFPVTLWVCVSICTYVSGSVGTCMCICTYIYMHVYVYTHAYLCMW